MSTVYPVYGTFRYGTERASTLPHPHTEVL